MVAIPVPWLRSRAISSNGAKVGCSPDTSMQRTTVKRSWLGSRISIGFVASSRCVLSLLPSARRLSAFCLQTELATGPDSNDPAVLQGTSDAHATISDPHHDSTGGVSEDRRDILKTRTAVFGINHHSPHPHPFLSDKPEDDYTAMSDVRHRPTKGRKDGGSRYRAVSILLTCS